MDTLNQLLSQIHDPRRMQANVPPSGISGNQPLDMSASGTPAALPRAQGAYGLKRKCLAFYVFRVKIIKLPSHEIVIIIAG